MASPSFTLENSYARDLEGFSVPWRPEPAPSPKSLFFNAPLAQELGLDSAALAGDAGAALFAGNALPEGASPSHRPTPVISSAASRRSSATAARCCSAR